MTSRNSWLDFLKFISIICVIIIHVGPFYQIDNLKPIGVIINNIMRFAVPCFFMCTGYFLNSSVDLFDEKDNQRIKRNVRKLFLIYILWCAIYILLMPKDHYFILNVMLFGTAPHLWFLSALIQCLLIKYFLNIFLNKCSVS
ncbi:TPA: acyltransferase family protein, partial [Klebsiella pneumoniae]